MIGKKIMNVDFSIVYTPKDEYNEVGYHTTYKKYKDSILKNGFKPSVQKNDWLGEGVYFWDNEDNAQWWSKRSTSASTCILVCDLKCQAVEYLDLDTQMKVFENFLKRYFKSATNDVVAKPNFKNNDERRKFFCDLYCTHNNIRILAYTFNHEIINQFGFKVATVKRRQICVREPKCISIRSVKEW